MTAQLLQRYIGFGLVTAVVVVAIFAPWLAPYDPNMSSASVLARPSAANWIGTDHLGRDAFSRLLYGARVSLVIGLAATIVGMAIGVPTGLVSGYVRGKIDLAVVQET